MLVGTAEVYDSIGLLEGYPLRGEERLTMQISDSAGNVRVWDFLVYKINNVKAHTVNQLMTYTLHFITYQSFLAYNRIITQSFRDLKITDIANTIFQESYNPSGAYIPPATLPANTIGENFDGTKKDLIVENTDDPVRLVIPRMDTQTAMNFLSRRAWNRESRSCSFRFFESSDAYFFVSDETLYRRGEEKERQFDFTFADKLLKDGTEYLDEWNNLDTLSNEHRVDTLDDIHGGAYRNRVLELDMVQRIANINDDGYNYDDVKGQYFPNTSKVEETLIDRHTPEFIEAYMRKDNARRFLIAKDYANVADVASYSLSGDRYYKTIAENRLPFLKHLNSITVEAAGSPRLDINVGDIINLHVPEISGDTSKTVTENAQLSGKYLVMNLTRSFNKEEARNVYTMMKMTWSQADAFEGTVSTTVDMDRIRRRQI